jgi:UDP-2,3-diacylglucosamine pyrophosphatase LpxH
LPNLSIGARSTRSVARKRIAKDGAMLVVISDLHLTDGTSGESISPGAFRIFAGRLAETAMRASWRADGSYRPIEEIDLLLLGDVLDVIRSTDWLAGAARPWHDQNADVAFDRVSRIARNILLQNDASLEAFRRLSRGLIQLPPADANGRPAAGAATLPVRTNIHYMTGNHDWFLHLPGTKYDALRRLVAERMGLAHRDASPFPHDPAESDDLARTLRMHKTFARHGDIYDPFNFERTRDASSLGDAIVIELVNRFAIEVQIQLGDELPDAVLRGLRELDNVRPLLLIPVWIDGLLERACPSVDLRKQVKRIWDALADDFLHLEFVRSRDTWNPADMVDGLQRALKFSKRLSLGWASAIANWVNSLRGSGCDSYYRHALAERDFRNRRAKHIVYGHTHAAEHVPLDASFSDGYVHNQAYFNSGTWRRVHRQTQFDLTENEFIAFDTMTLLAFFQGDERGGRPYESWSGTLGIDAPATISYRLDRGHRDALHPTFEASHAPSESIRPSNLSVRGPNFSLSTRAGQPVAER